jgi:hypothetical protein
MTTSAPAPRFIVIDTLAGQMTDLIPRGSRRRQLRYQIVDTTIANAWDRVYDELSSKKVADATARDLNRGTYGPLAEARS